jgi:hypothetical protein
MGADKPESTARGKGWDRQVGAGYLPTNGKRGGKVHFTNRPLLAGALTMLQTSAS